MLAGSSSLAAWPPFSRGLSAAVLLGGLAAQLFPRLREAAGLVCAEAFTRPWTLITCALVGDLVTAVPYAVAALFLTRIVEPLHGARELLKLLAFAVAVASCGTVAVVTLAYYSALLGEKGFSEVGRAGSVLFRPLAGFEAGAAALLVAVKQAIPDNEVALLGGALRFRAKHLPALYVAAASAAALALGGAVRVVPFVLLGTYGAWGYLRFVQTRNGVRGDLSDEFRLASFLPRLLQPPVDRLADACTRLTGLGDAAGSEAHQEAWRSALGGAAPPGAGFGGEADLDAARRRQRGAKALEERLGLKKAASAASTPGNASGTAAAAAAPGAAELPAAAADAAAAAAEAAEAAVQAGSA